jgi:carbon monoxide dehydrogenase subunit G
VIIPPPEEVFDFLTRTENIPVWDSSVIRAEQVGEGPVGLGTRSRGTSKIMGRHFDWVTENVHFDSPKESVIRSVEGDLSFTISNHLEPQGEGTKLTYRVEADSFVEKAHTRTVRANLKTLADLLAEHPNGV